MASGTSRKYRPILNYTLPKRRPRRFLQPSWIAFSGAGTTALAAYKLGRNCIGIELNPEYIAIAEKRLEPETEKLSLFKETHNAY